MSAGVDAPLRRPSAGNGYGRRRGHAQGRERAGVLRRLLAHPELAVVMAAAAALNLWGLSINGWANTYYGAAVRSMSASWHDFLFASLDSSGLMTVDKPPLALWAQALSARIFGFHPLSLLVPQALMGVAAAGLTYDLTRRYFGRTGGFVAGLVLATTPIIVAVSRHNNPDELLVLCSVAALWCFVRAMDTGATKWLVFTGICVGLGFETKMLVAFMVVPGIALAYFWLAPRGRVRAVGQLLAGGAAMIAVSAAWPLLVTLTASTDRPWISGTSDNSIWSLIFGYNGLGRVAGQTGGPGGAPGGFGGGNTMFGGATGPFRLLQSGLGDQAGWLLGAAVASALVLIVLTRLRRRDVRTGWVIAVGGALAVSVVVFSFSSGIFHPYYVSFLAPFTAALLGAGVGLMLPARWGGVGRGRSMQLAAPAVIAGGVVTELVVLNGLDGALAWGFPIAGVALVCALALAFAMPGWLRAGVVAVALVALLAAPATWAAQTDGHATSSTFPAGGSASASLVGPGGRGGFGGRGFGGGRFGGGRFGGPPPGAGMPSGSAIGRLFTTPSGSSSAARGGGFGGGAPFGGDSQTLQAAIAYAKAHGGGTIGVESQSEAATAILSSHASVAGLGGFSGRESSVTVSWLAQEVAAGRLRWILVDGGSNRPRRGGDTRSGSAGAMSAAAKACTAVKLGTTTTATATGGARSATLYDCADNRT